MADQVPVVPVDAQQLQDALAVPPAQAGAAQDAQNIDGGDPPAAVAQVAVPAAQPAHQPHADVNVNALKDKVERLESTLTRTSVTSALDTVRQLASRPSPLVDRYALIAALEQLADVSRETVHPDRKRFDAIF
ncbi:uncharacterized protein LOC144639424 [Oculina patagonica]